MKNTGKIAIGALCVLLITAVIWGFNANTARAQATNQIESNYQRTFYDLISTVENLSVLTGKVQVASGLQQEIKYLSDINSHAGFASSNLAALPLEHDTLTRTERFLNQLADYADSISKKLLSGSELSAQDKETLRKLNEQTITLSKDLRGLLNQINEEGFTFYTAHAEQQQEKLSQDAGSLGGGFTQINDTFMDYPTLIYDGPFSDHMDSRKPKGLTGSAVDENSAKKKAQSLAAMLAASSTQNANSTPGSTQMRTSSSTPGATKVYYLSETSENAAIPVYCFSTEKTDTGSGTHIDISMTGGHAIMANQPRPVTQSAITDEAAKEKASAFLKQLGFSNMESTYATTQQNTVIFAFAAAQNGILLYPDQIKVKVALDNGEIIGLDTADYFMSHTERSIPAATFSLTAAEKTLSPNLAVENRRLALIPNDSGSEVLCYEFRGTYNNNIYLVYINAQTGTEENILQVISTPGGRFTI